MKSSSLRLSLPLLLVLFASCNKWEDFLETHGPKPETSCELMQSFGSGHISLFRKENDNTTGKTKKVIASAYTFNPTDSIALILHYSGNLVYMLMEENAADTFLVATFNDKGKLEKLARSNTTVEPEKYVFQSLEFEYSGQQLSRYIIIGETTYDPEENETVKDMDAPISISYDSYGNVVRVYNHEPYEPVEVTYTYEYSVKAKRQFYPDGFGADLGTSTLYLAQFMGWLPDLEPVHKRIASKSSADYLGYDAHFTGHGYDSNKNLFSYRNSNEETYSNVWSCSKN